MPRKKDENYKEVSSEDTIIEIPEDETFSIGQFYEDVASKRVYTTVKNSPASTPAP